VNYETVKLEVNVSSKEAIQKKTREYSVHLSLPSSWRR